MRPEQQKMWNILSTPFDSPKNFELLMMYISQGESSVVLKLFETPKIVTMNGVVLRHGIDYVVNINIDKTATIFLEKRSAPGDVIRVY